MKSNLKRNGKVKITEGRTMADPIETAITWDHETGKITISTRRSGVALKLKRFGLTPLHEDDPDTPHGYTTFQTNEGEVVVSLRCSRKGKLTKNELESLRAARSARQPAANAN